MPLALIQTIERHRGDLLRALEEVEELVGEPTTGDELAVAIETVRRELLAHEATAERLVVGRLRDLRLVDSRQLSVLDDELERLSREAIRLISGQPDRRAVVAFCLAVRDHIERKARAVVPGVRCALAEGRLSVVPRLYVEDVHRQWGDSGPLFPEEWLG